MGFEEDLWKVRRLLEKDDDAFPLSGCIRTGYIIENIFGFGRLAGRVPGTYGIHCWNETRDGRYADLTLDQFNEGRGWNYSGVTISRPEDYPFEVDSEVLAEVLSLDGMIKMHFGDLIESVRSSFKSPGKV